MDFYLSFLADNWWRFLITALAAYLLGSINTAVMVTRIVTKGKKDIRQLGSGNAGFTNVLRSVGKVPAIITIVSDALKCVIAVILGGIVFSFIGTESQVLSNEFVNCGKYIAGIFCIIGHSYPVYFHFKGGKGVATGLGVLVFLMPKVAGTVFLVWLVLVLLTRYVSLGSIVAAILTPVAAWYYSYPVAYTILGAIAGFFVVLRHKENIGRLLSGTESKIKPGNAKNLSK